MEPVNATGSRERATKISQRRVCNLVGVDPKTVRRERLADHAEIRKQMHEIAGNRRRIGYRRIGIMLEREGFTMNEKKLYRLYKEEGLSVRRRRGRKRGSVRGRGVLFHRAVGVTGVAIEDVGLWWSCELQPLTEETPDDRDQYDADRLASKA